jgi:taurine dioxygenase
MDATITHLANHTGAEVRGIDLTPPLAEETRDRLNQTFSERGVLVIRGQTLSPHQMLGAVRLFGDVFPQHNTRFALPVCPEIHYISNQDAFPDGRRYIPGDGWHTDHSNDVRPPKATVLHAITLPGTGGDTQFANMAAAYDALPDATRRRLEGLSSIHVYQSTHSTRKLMALPSAGTSAKRRPASPRSHASRDRQEVTIHQSDPD